MKNLLQMNVLQNRKLNTLIIILFTIYTYASNPFPAHYSSFLKTACDACGCSNNGGSLGMGGVIENNFVGIRYLFQKYQSKDGIFNDSPIINEYFNTIQVWSRIPIIKNLEVQAFIPFHFHNREYVDKTTSINGLGDASILINYTIIDQIKGNYNKKTDKVSSSNHLLKIGIGVKLPTGTYNKAINNSINPSFQLGTGSFDVISNLQYTFKYNNFGITNYANYYVKTVNEEQYRFGNQFNFNSTLFYVFKDVKKRTFVPSTGISGEFYDPNEQFNLPIKKTEGYALFGNIGLEYNTKNITLGASSMYPINQKLAQGTIKTKYRTSLYVNYNF